MPYWAEGAAIAGLRRPSSPRPPACADAWKASTSLTPSLLPAWIALLQKPNAAVGQPFPSIPGQTLAADDKGSSAPGLIKNFRFADFTGRFLDQEDVR